jgi:hypothetical protein
MPFFDKFKPEISNYRGSLASGKVASDHFRVVEFPILNDKF